jgi:nitroreductase
MEAVKMDVMQAIRTRRSVRRFSGWPSKAIALMLEAARLAPSGGNGQDWAFGAVTDREQIRRLAVAAGGQDWIATAPLVFALCASLEWKLADLSADDFSLAVNRERFGADFVEVLRRYPDQRAVSMLFSNSTPLIPGEHIALVAAALGLSSCWIGYLDVRAASAILELPPNYACLFLLPVGYAAMEPRPQVRRPLAEVSFGDRWGEQVAE